MISNWLQTGEDDWIYTLIISKHPDEKLCKIIRIDELAKRLASAGHRECRVIFYEKTREDISKLNTL